MTDALIHRLTMAQAGSCSCMINSEEEMWHKPECHYRLFYEAARALRRAQYSVRVQQNVPDTMKRCCLQALVEQGIYDDFRIAVEGELFLCPYCKSMHQKVGGTFIEKMNNG